MESQLKTKFLWKSKSTSCTCWLCNKKIKANEYMATFKVGTHYVNICLDHFKISDCNMCKHQYDCLTNENKSICIDGHKVETHFHGIPNMKYEPKI